MTTGALDGSANPPMRSGTSKILIGMLIAASFVASMATAHPDDLPGTDVVQYFNEKDGSLVLTSLAPSAKNPTSWSTTGDYDVRKGLKLVIPIDNSAADDIINEDAGVGGLVKYAFSVHHTGTSFFSPPSGSLDWRLVEGARSSKMVLNCPYNDMYYCDYYHQQPLYTAAFPGHEGKGTAHTHGDGSNPDAPLTSGDFGWVLAYTVPACSTTNCPISIMGGYDSYTFTVTIDGSTSVTYRANGQAPPPAPAPADNETAGNATDGNGTQDPAGPGDGNGTSGNGTEGNGTTAGGHGASPAGAGHAESAFLPQAYNAQPARGQSPGLPAFALIGGIAGTAILMRRRVR